MQGTEIVLMQARRSSGVGTVKAVPGRAVPALLAPRDEHDEVDRDQQCRGLADCPEAAVPVLQVFMTE